MEFGTFPSGGSQVVVIEPPSEALVSVPAPTALTVPTVVPAQLPQPQMPTVYQELAVAEIPDYDLYPTLEIDQVSFLRGYEPIDASAYEWVYDPNTRKFINAEIVRRGGRGTKSREEFVAEFFPQIEENRKNCRKLEIQRIELKSGFVPPLEGKEEDSVPLQIVIKSGDGDILLTTNQVWSVDATRQDLMDQLSAELTDKYGILPSNFRIVIYHPKLYDFANTRPYALSGSYELYEDRTIGDALSTFPGLGLDPTIFALPVEIVPARHSQKRQLSAPITIPPGLTRKERLDYLSQEIRRRRMLEQELVRRSGRTREEQAADWAAVMGDRGSRPKPAQPPPVMTRENEYLVREMLGVLDQLFAAVTGTRVYDPQSYADLKRWLVSAILSGKVAEGVDYALVFKQVATAILNDEYPDRPSGAWLPFLTQVDYWVDEVQHIESRSSQTRDREPISSIDPETGKLVVVDYEEELKDDLVEGQPLAFEFITRPPSEIEEAEQIDAPKIQCHTCKRWRPLRTDTRRIEFTITYRAPDGITRTLECEEFGFVFQHRANGGREEYVPMNSEYVIVYNPSKELVDQIDVPELLQPNNTVAGFATTDVHYARGKPVYYDVQFNLQPGIEFETPAPTTAVYALQRLNAIAPDGTVFIADPNDPRIFRALREGKATSYYCRGFNPETGQEETRPIPLDALKSFTESIWECGDEGMDVHSAPLTETLNRLRDLENEYRSGLLDEEGQRLLAARIANLKKSLHGAPQESDEDIRRRIATTNPEVLTENVNQDFENLLEDLDTLLDQRLRDAGAYYVEQEVEAVSAPDEDIAEQRRVEQVRAKRGLSPEDPELLEEQVGAAKRMRYAEERSFAPEPLVGATALETEALEERDALRDYLQGLLLERAERVAFINDVLLQNILSIAESKQQSVVQRANENRLPELDPLADFADPELAATYQEFVDSLGPLNREIAQAQQTLQSL